MADPVLLFGHRTEAETLRRLEAVLFASAEPLSLTELAERLGDGDDLATRLKELQTIYANRGVNLVEVAGGYCFRTAPDLAHLLVGERSQNRRLSRAAMETLAIIAYHQPVTRAEIEEVRGVAVAKGTLDILLETGWVRLRGRRRVPGKPVTFGTTSAFLEAFQLAAIGDLPGLDDLRGAGLLEGTPPSGFVVPTPRDGDALTADEAPLDEADEDDPSEDDLSEDDPSEGTPSEDAPSPGEPMSDRPSPSGPSPDGQAAPLVHGSYGDGRDASAARDRTGGTVANVTAIGRQGEDDVAPR